MIHYLTIFGCFNVTRWHLWITLKTAGINPVCSSVVQHLEMPDGTAMSFKNYNIYKGSLEILRHMF